jgi:hypothetical protein
MQAVAQDLYAKKPGAGAPPDADAAGGESAAGGGAAGADRESGAEGGDVIDADFTMKDDKK